MNTFKFCSSLIILALALVNAKNVQLSQQQILKDLIDQLNTGSRTVNVDVDKLVEELILLPLRIYIATIYEPTNVQDDRFQWKYTFPNSMANGIMTLKEGVLQGGSSVASGGVNTLHPEQGNWILTVPITFNRLCYNYRYSTKYKKMTLKGSVRGDLLNPLYTLLFKIEPINLKVKLRGIHIDRNCKRNVRVEGNHTPKMHTMLTAVLKKRLTETRFTEILADEIATFVKVLLRN